MTALKDEMTLRYSAASQFRKTFKQSEKSKTETVVQVRTYSRMGESVIVIVDDGNGKSNVLRIFPL